MTSLSLCEFVCRPIYTFTDCRSFLSLVSYATNSDLVTIPIPRDCQLKSFKTHIKGVLLKAGVDGDSVVVVFDDCHMRQAEFAEIVNTLLNGADLAGLIAHEEQAREAVYAYVCLIANLRLGSYRLCL